MAQPVPTAALTPPPDTNATDLKFLHHELRNQGTGSVPESDVPIRGIGEPP
jgi:hypothetical protein